MVGRNGMDNLPGFIEFFGQPGSDDRMGPFDFMINGFADIMQQSHPAGHFGIESQFRSHDPAEEANFHRVLQHILSVAGAEL